MDIYETVTARIVAALETARDWHKPWTSAFSGEQGGTLLRPINCRTGKGYRGINVPLLWGARRSSPHWGTYRAWAELGAQVRKGERATHIVFWKQIARRAEAGSEDDPGKYLLARGYAVFNSEQVEGWQAPAAPAPAPIAPAAAFEPDAAADAFVAAQLDELYQIERWGEDPIATQRHHGIRHDMHAAARFLVLLQEARLGG